MRKPILIGNWKLNASIESTVSRTEGFLSECLEYLKNNHISQDQFFSKMDLAVCPPGVYIPMAVQILGESFIGVGAQTVSQYESGAYTGEVSAQMLSDVGCEYVLMGHSERREYFKESDEAINQKLSQALNSGLTPVLCVGESLETRERGEQSAFEWVIKQIHSALDHIEKSLLDRIIIAYEPIWAIGTGLTASPEQAENMHAHIRENIEQSYGQSLAKNIRILYGGSLKPSNAQELLSQPNIDGGLVGGASLDPKVFLELCMELYRV